MAVGVSRAVADPGVEAGSPAMHRLAFVVIGAPKSGTTTLFEHLRGHPQLHLPPGKENPFLSADEAYERGWHEFAARVFDGAQPGQLLGQVEPAYMVDPEPVAVRLA